MNRSSISFLDLVAPLGVLVIAVGVFAYFQFSYLPATDFTPVKNTYPTDFVIKSMAADGVYSQASNLVVPSAGGSVSILPQTPVQTYSSSDLGKTDLSQFNQ